MDYQGAQGEPGSGAGRGGGGGGSIRDAGGAFGKMQVANEEEYFHKKQKEQLQDLKTKLNEDKSRDSSKKFARMYSPTGSGLQGDAGSGAGRGGGGGGAIRDAGGSFAKMEIAHEEEYFYKKQREQLEKLKEDKIKQEHFHEEAIKDLQDQIKRHTDYLKKLKK